MSTKSIINQEEQYLAIGWRIWVSRSIEILIGLIIVAAGLIKANEIADSIEQIAAYKIVITPWAVKFLVWLLILTECSLGASLIFGYKRYATSLATFGLIFIFLGTLGWAWYTGATADCGCFGAWVKHTPQQALSFDLLMLGSFAIAKILNRKESNNYQMLRLVGVVLIAAVGLSMATIATLNPKQSTDPVVRIQASNPKLFQSVTISNIPVDVRQGFYLVALIDTGCDHCQANVLIFNQIVEKSEKLPLLVAICPNNESDIKWFEKNFNPKFPIGQISNEDFLRLLERGDTPRTFLLRDAAVIKIWDGKAPSEAEVKAALDVKVEK